MREPAPAEPPTPPGLGRRLLCLIYETLLLAAVCLTAAVPPVGLAALTGAPLPRAAVQAYVLAVGAAYFIPQWRAGHTLPMKTWRIRLVSAHGGAPTLRQAALRYVLALASWALAGAGYLWAIVDRDRQFLHDRLAGTRLVAVPR